MCEFLLIGIVIQLKQFILKLVLKILQCHWKMPIILEVLLNESCSLGNSQMGKSRFLC